MPSDAQNRPAIYNSDAYAEDICRALYSATLTAWGDSEAFVSQLFAATASERGYPYWEDYLGIELVYSSHRQRNRILEHLRRGEIFNTERIKGLVRQIANIDCDVTDDVNSVTITFASAVSEDTFSQIRAAIEFEKPLHIDVVYVTSTIL